MKEALKNYINRCRCCLEQFCDNENITPITEFFEIQFYAFTQLELEVNELLSNHVCEFCHSELLRFSVFKKDLIEKQQKLYGLLKQHIRKVEEEAKISSNKFKECKREDDTADDNEEDVIDEEPEEEEEEEEVEVGEEDNIDDEVEKEEEESEIHETEFEINSDNDNDSDYYLCRKTKLKSPINSNKQSEFTCDYCQLNFKNKQGLSRHVQSHSNEKVLNWKCDICEFVTSSKQKLNVHKVRFHSKTKRPYIKDKQSKNSAGAAKEKYKCFCGASFEKKLSLRSHRSRRHGTINKCNFGCHLTFDTTGEWIRHVRDKHKNYEDECLKMVTAYKKNEWFTEVKIEKGDESLLQCDKCNFETNDMLNLQNHVKIKHSMDDEESKAECTECFKLFANNASLRMHYQTVHLEIRKFQCMYCKACFKQLVHLKEHMMGIHKALYKPYCCWCGVSFSTLSSLKQHKLQMHQEDNKIINVGAKESKTLPITSSAPDSKLVCVCEKIFQYPSRLIAHQQSCKIFKDQLPNKNMEHQDKSKDNDGILNEKHEQNQFKCAECDRLFVHRSNLIRHQKVKNHLKPDQIERLKYSCDNCGEKFFNVRSKNYHIRLKPNCGSK